MYEASIILPRKRNKGDSVSSGRKIVKTTAPAPYIGHRGPVTKPRLMNFFRASAQKITSAHHPRKEYMK